MHNFIINITVSFKRHIIGINLYAFLFCSLIYTNETIAISLDPISHNVLFLDSVFPIYQPDLFSKEYIIEGNSGFPISVYLLEDLYVNINDSIRTNSAFLYKQGDVGYRDFTFDVKTKVSESGILKLIGNGMTYPGQTNQYGNGNILQNYLLHFSKNFTSSKLSFYSGYHLENEEIHYINSNSGESYFSGINYTQSTDKYHINLKYAFQIGKNNFSTSHHIQWLKGEANYSLSKILKIYIDNVYKDLYVVKDASNPQAEISVFEFQDVINGFNSFASGINVNLNISDLNFGAKLFEENLYPEITVNTKFKYFNISFGLLNNHFFDNISLISPSREMTMSYKYYFSNLSYKSNSFQIEIEPRYIKDTYWTLNNKFKVNCNILNSKTSIIPFLLSLDKSKLSLSIVSNHYNSLPGFITTHVNSSLNFLEFQSQRRYKKFVGIKYNAIQFDNRYSMNLDEIPLYSTNLGGISYITEWNNNKLKNYLDFYIGLEFEKFIFSWHFTNVLAENYLINEHGKIQNLYMQYFTIKWKFDN